MKKITVFSLFLILISFIALPANAAIAPSTVYTYKSSLQDISCSLNYCVAVGNNVILRSIDKGTTWKVVLSKIISTPNEGSNLSDVDCAENLCIAVGAGANMMRSSDSGLTWKVVNNFLVALNKDSFTSNLSNVDCINKNTCYAVGGNFHNGGDLTKFDKAFGSVILKTIDGGVTWNVNKLEKAKFDYPLPGLKQTIRPDMFELKYTENDELPIHLIKKILCKNENECFGIGASRSIFHTVDGWKTATLQQFKIDNPLRVLTNGPYDYNSFAYVVDGNNVKILQKVARYEFSDISFTGDGGVLVEDVGYSPYGGTRVILKSLDNGNTWKNINVPLSILSSTGGGKISCSGTTCVIATQNVPAKRIDILTSLDNGNTWKTSLYKKLATISGLACADSKSCFAVGDTIPKGVIIKVK